MMRFLLILSLLICIFVSCKDSSGPNKTGENLIREALQNITLAFNFNELEEIMSYYHPDFLHNGEDLDDEYTVWELRTIDYNEMEIEDISVEFTGDDRAVASFILKFSGSSGTDTWNEPSSENGDLSYFFLDYSGWVIIGNQLE